MEGILEDSIYFYWEMQGLIGDNQHGLVHGRSSFTNLSEFSEEVTKRNVEGSAVDVVYMNFSKAFELLVGRSDG